MSLCDILRVPPLLIVDNIFSYNFGFQDVDDTIITLINSLENSVLFSLENHEHVQYFTQLLLFLYLLLKITASCLIVCFSLCIIVLPTRYLYLVYIHVAPICAVIFSCWVNLLTLNVLSKQCANFNIDTINEAITWDKDIILGLFMQLQIVNFLCLLFRNIILQFFLSLVFNFVQACATNHSTHEVVCFSFIIPNLMVLITCMCGIWNTVTMLLLSLLPLYIVLKTICFNICTLMHLICYGFNHIRENINHYPLMVFVVMEWSRLKVPKVLRLFWAIRILDSYILSLLTKEIKHETVKYLCLKLCDTFIAVLGMTSFVSYFCHYIQAFFQWVLLTEDVGRINIVLRSVILFFVLALQTELTNLEPEERLLQLFRNICVTCCFLMIYVHDLVQSSLCYLSINRNKSINRHLRALLVSGCLIVFSISMLKYLNYYQYFGNWSLEFYAMNFLIVVKVLVTLAVYSLYMIEGYHKTNWENMDDYIFYIKSFGGVANYCLCTSIYLNGILNMNFENIRIPLAPLMCVHAYHVVWCSLKDGWRVLIRRRLASRKVELFADATSAQLSEFDDICSICHHNMVSAKITKCNHFFHSICLRKWLELKNNCPLCHDILYQA